MAADGHCGLWEEHDEAAAAKLLLGQEHAVKADAEAIDCGADCHKGAVEARASINLKTRLPIATAPVAPAENCDLAMDQRVPGEVLGAPDRT